MDWWWTRDFLLSAFEAVCCVRRRAAPVSRLQARRIARVVAGFARLPLPVNHQSIHFFVVVDHQGIHFFVVSTTNPIRSYSQRKSTTNPWQFFTCPQPIQKFPHILTSQTPTNNIPTNAAARRRRPTRAHSTRHLYTNLFVVRIQKPFSTNKQISAPSARQSRTQNVDEDDVTASRCNPLMAT